MNAEYRDSQTPGNGTIYLDELNGLSSLDGIAVQRASDKKFLTGSNKNPWVGEVFYFPVSAHADGKSATIAIGPDIVNQLDPQEQYALRIKGHDGRIRLKLETITYSPSGSMGNTAQVAGQSNNAAQEPTRAQPVNPNSAQPIQDTAPLQMTPQAHAADANKKFIWPIIIGLLIACATAWYFLAAGKNEATAPDAETASQKREPNPSPTAAPEKPLPQSVEEQVRQFFKQSRISPGEAATLAAKLPAKTPAEQDAIYRLWYFAAENGAPDAFLPYGNILDPSLPGFGTIHKNAIEAWQSYEKAMQTLPQEAEQARTHLRNWLAEAAQNGDSQAKDWLLLIDSPR